MPGTPPPPRWIADEMLGRLARYLRFLGHDVVYVRGLPDRAIADRSIQEGRTLLTRDVALASRTPGALLLRSPDIADQLREVRLARPHASFEPTFERCSECNEPLDLLPPSSRIEPARNGADRTARGTPPPGAVVYACPRCHRRYWEGSHTRTIRTSLRRWLSDQEGTG